MSKLLLDRIFINYIWSYYIGWIGCGFYDVIILLYICVVRL